MKKIVTIGGGTGSYNVLSGIKNIDNVSISALVSMADDGGSTGRLRDELGVLPPGDIRQCLVALSENTKEIRELMNYRFEEGSLKGHTFGNIFLAALEKVTGSFSKGVEVASEILKVKGKVVPITNDNAKLSILLSNGDFFEGVVTVDGISFSEFNLKRIFYKNENISLSKEAKKAIKEADYIIIGPGNYYCSVVPNLIVNGFKDAIKKTKAKIIFPINLTNKKEHTNNWKASDYTKDIESYIGKKVDVILINNKKPSKEQIEKYKLKEGDGVLVEDDLKDKRVIRMPLLSHLVIKFNKYDVKSNIRSFIRHDSNKIGKCIEKIIKEDNIKFIFDFDDVLFNNTKEFKEHMYFSLEKAGISKDKIKKKYQEIRKLNTPFSLKMFIALFLKDKKDIESLYNKIISKSPDFVNKDFIPLLKKIGKENCFLVSQGEEEFQLDKINKSKMAQYFKEIIITIGSKKEAIEQICQNNLDSTIYFVDDRDFFLKDLDKNKHKNLKTILYKEENFNQIKDLINKNF